MQDPPPPPPPVAAEEKKKRTSALSGFTRNVNILDGLLDEESPTLLVDPQFEKVKRAWENLELAHDEFIAATNLDIDTDPAGLSYIDAPANRYSEIVKKYSAYLKGQRVVEDQYLQKKAEDDRKAAEDDRKVKEKEARDAEEAVRRDEMKAKFSCAKAELETSIDTFQRMTLKVKDALTAAESSDLEKRLEWGKIESDFLAMKNQLIQVSGLAGDEDITELRTKFKDTAESVYSDTQAWIFSESKDVTSVSASSVSAVSSNNTTKKESVPLPIFHGDETKSPFLMFPSWKKQWDTLIVEYPERHRATMLMNKTDDAAKKKFAGWESNYSEMMSRLEKYFGNAQKVISSVMKEVTSQSPIATGNYSSLVLYTSTLEENYNRLKGVDLVHELSNSSTLKNIMSKFPREVSEEWYRHLSGKDQSVQLQPFEEFIDWLGKQRDIWERMSSIQPPGKQQLSFNVQTTEKTCFKCGEKGHIKSNCPKNKPGSGGGGGAVGDGDGGGKKKRRLPKIKKFWCAYHKNDSSKRCHSNNCRDLQMMTDVNKRIQLLKENGDCQHCCGDHKSDECRQQGRVCGGGKQDRGCTQSHPLHELFCAAAKCFHLSVVHTAEVSGETDGDEDGVLLQIMVVRAKKRNSFAVVLWDLGSTSNFVRSEYAKSCGFQGKEVTLSVVTLSGKETDFLTVIRYNCCIRDTNGKLWKLTAYGLESITGAMSSIDAEVIKKIFPRISDETIQAVKRESLVVDFLIGSQHPSWHPKMKVRAEGGGDMWLYTCRYGECLGGRHPLVKEETKKSDSIFHVNHVYHSSSIVQNHLSDHALEFCEDRFREQSYEDVQIVELPPESCEGAVEMSGVDRSAEGRDAAVAICHVCKSAVVSEEYFLQSESMGTLVEPRCGGCRCGTCPVPGSLYSHREQQEYDKIQKNLFYDDESRCWYTEYPWKRDRSVLPRNDKQALQSLLTLEKYLQKNPDLAVDFRNQIDQMVERGAAVVLSDKQLQSWKGPYYYLPVLGVKGKKKQLRVVFDASRKQGGYPSLNDCLDKGPDRFLNSLLSVVLGFRNGRVGAVADIKKFHNCVKLFLPDIHMQRFLWRSLETDSPPKTYAVAVNNFGVKPANCIATSALHKSADKYAAQYPAASRDVRKQTYIDDALIAGENMTETRTKTEQIDEICDDASMPNKGWTFSGDVNGSAVLIGADEGVVAEDRVLGLLWQSETDTFHYSVELDVKYRNEKDVVCELKATTVQLLPSFSTSIITRRLMLRNTAKIFDPCGWWCPVLLEAKLLMRESWTDKSLGWDDPMPHDLSQRWWDLMKSLLRLREVEFPRSLWPEKEVKGLPMLIVFSDGSLKAYGAVAYIRWELQEGGFWTQLIMAKSKIAPKGEFKVPRLELNGTVLGNRIKNFIKKETNLEFSQEVQLVDSSTALGYVNKDSGSLGLYEAIRVAEVQMSNNFVDGRLENFAWVAGEKNPADWCTKPRSVDDVRDNSFWQKGPDFLRTEVSSWPIMHTFKTKLEGEKPVKTAVCSHIQRKKSELHLKIWDILRRVVGRISRWKMLCRVVAWMLRLGWRKGDDRGAPLEHEEVKAARCLLVKFAQEDIKEELEEAIQNGKGRFRKLAPVLGEDGIYRVGSRMQSIVPFTLDAKLPKILPHNHPITKLIMTESHNFCHAGHDGTLCRFRAQGYWAVKAGCLAKKTRSECISCRKIDRILLSQPLGGFPLDRLSEPVAWGYCQLDLFGPFECRSDVNSRAKKKTWGIIIEDSNSGAVHLDIVQDYSAHAVMMSLRRFGSLRGWPGVLCSDPGSQLESASGKLDTWWSSMGDKLRSLGSEKNFRWEISPPDSPWRQGKAERRIAIVKKLLRLAVGDTRVSPVELQTILMEIANMCNERPIGLSKPRADGSYVLVTPNQLLLGRSSSVLPDDAQLASEMPVASRYRVVNHVTTSFWNMWSSHVSPGLVTRQKWHKKSRNLCKGDLVMICEDSKVKAKYKLGVVDEVKVSQDGIVRSASVRYCNIRKNNKNEDVVTYVFVKRSVQRLALILPVEESSDSIVVKDYEHSVQCTTETSGGV